MSTLAARLLVADALLKPRRVTCHGQLGSKSKPLSLARPHGRPACSKPGSAWRPAAKLHTSKLGSLQIPAASSVDESTTLTRAPVVAPASAPEAAQSSHPFSWTKQWWPLIPLNYLDPVKPKAMEVVGVKLVVWRDGEGQWRCFKDACPHRLAPLSEGRIESDGTLMCSYHAWRFDGVGKCTSIPQATSKEAEETAKKSKRSCATAFPVQEKAGLLWVWPDESEARWVEASAVKPVVSRLAEETYAATGSVTWFMRDVPYSYDMLVENLFDPSHVPVSHHKMGSPELTRYNLGRIAVQPDKSDSSAPWLETPSEPTLKLKHSSVMASQPADKMDILLRFNAPQLIQYGNVNNPSYSTQLYTIPVGAGKSRAIHVDIFQFPPPPAVSNIVEWCKQALFRAVMRKLLVPKNAHRRMLSLFDGDGIFLTTQESNLHRQHQGQWKKAYYMPAACDGTVVAARKWIDQVGHPFPVNPDIVQGKFNRSMLLDRYSQHTAHCPICQSEVKRLDLLLQGAKALASTCFLAACAVLTSVGWVGLAQAEAPFLTLPGVSVVVLLGTAVWTAMGWTRSLQAARQEYFFADFVHAEKD